MQHNIKTTPGSWYSVTATQAATVTASIDGESVTLAILAEGGSVTICAPANSIAIDTQGKLRVLPTKAPGSMPGSGGASAADIAIDSEPTEGSANAVSSGGAWGQSLHPSVGPESLAAGDGAQAFSNGGLAIGLRAQAGSPGYAAPNATAIGMQATAQANSVAHGAHSEAAEGSVSVGSFAGSDSNAVAIGYKATSGKYAVALGCGANGGGDCNVIIGANAFIFSSYTTDAVALGHYARSESMGVAAGAASAANNDACSFGYAAMSASVGMAAGYYAYAGNYSVAAGSYAATGACALAAGNSASADSYSIALGCNARCGAQGSAAIGFKAINGDTGSAVISAAAADPAEDVSLLEPYPGGGWVINGLIASVTVTQLYLIGAGSALSNQYTGGEAGLGFIEYEPGRIDGSIGRIVRRGCRKLSELLTDHATDFTPSLSPQNVTTCCY